ncbi:hypothetical protein OG756_40410 [Streptomyces sp. NBC_01310]|uniref:hypothetical protein n=1 Tax=Streptomyces sp. NBC_01310 TaxID=2903820 RepID=UPI0035B5F555|nr:hypothetical protein OG756_00985 [Streptomyces sp. NBC_01310]WSJ63688.1 hypothetical protein OG756_40410 [Streptomyces sp. NBC_01310]
MTDLTTTVIAAHGGLERYRQYHSAEVRFRSGGALWALKGQSGVLDSSTVRVDLDRQHASHRPFTGPGLHSSFTAERVAVETDDGQVLAERLDPRSSFAGHTLETPWDELHLAYFAGYAMWTYLTSPFTFASPGFTAEELPLAPATEEGEVWRRLKVTFPAEIATHAPEQIFHFDQTGLLRRHDYTAEVLNAGPAAHYVSDYKEFGGIMVPTKRRVYPVGQDGAPIRDIELVTIDIDHVEFS